MVPRSSENCRGHSGSWSGNDNPPEVSSQAAPSMLRFQSGKIMLAKDHFPRNLWGSRVRRTWTTHLALMPAGWLTVRLQRLEY